MDKADQEIKVLRLTKNECRILSMALNQQASDMLDNAEKYPNDSVGQKLYTRSCRILIDIRDKVDAQRKLEKVV